MSDQVDENDLPSALMVGTEWLLDKCDITVSVVQKEMACWLRKRGINVHCTVLSATDEEKEDAKCNGVNLLLPQSKRDLKNKTPSSDWLLLHESFFANLQQLKNLCFILGHDCQDGTMDAARSIQKEIFQSAKLISLKYDIPEKLYNLPKSDQRERQRLSIEYAKMADIVVSIGPKVWSHYNNKFRIFKNKEHLCYLPYVDTTFLTYGVKEPSVEHGIYILSFQTLANAIDDEDFEQFDIIARAIGKVSEGFEGRTISEPSWNVRGIQENLCISYQKRLYKTACKPANLSINTAPICSLNELFEELQQTDLAVLGACNYRDSYGIVGLLACTIGVPVLLSRNSGLAMFLKKHFPVLADPFIVDDAEICTYDDIDRESDKWVKKIHKILHNYSGFFENMQNLKNAIRNCASEGIMAKSHTELIKWFHSQNPKSREEENMQKEGESESERYADNEFQPESENVPVAQGEVKTTREAGDVSIKVTALKEEQNSEGQVINRTDIQLFGKIPLSEMPHIEQCFKNIGLTLKRHTSGCFILTVECRVLEALERLWADYKADIVNTLFEKDIKNSKALQDYQASNICVETVIETWEYIKCKLEITLRNEAEEKVLTSISWKSMLTHKRNIPQYLDLDVLGEPKPDDKNIPLVKHLLNEAAKYHKYYRKCQKSIKSIEAAKYDIQMLEARLEEMKSAKATYHHDPAESFSLKIAKFFQRKKEQVDELATENRELKNTLQRVQSELSSKVEESSITQKADINKIESSLDSKEVQVEKHLTEYGDGKEKTETSDIEGNEAPKGQDEEELMKYLEDLLRPIEDFKKSEDVDNEEASSRALLNAAVLDGNLDIVMQVVSRYEAKKYIQEGFILAVVKNQAEIVKYLLGFGISKEDIDAGICVASSFGCTATLLLLLDSGGDVNAISDEEKSALHQAIEEKKFDAVRVLVERGADIESFNLQNGRTALSIAATVNFVECLEYLLSKGVDVDIRCVSGRTPLHYGAEYGNVETVEYLLSRGADVNAQDSNMKTPLHLAAESDNVDIARQLIKAGADIKIEDRSGESPIQIAETKQNSQMSMVFRGEEPEPKVTVKGEEKISISPEEQKFLKKIKAFQKSGGDINDQDKDGKIPLHVSTTNNWISAVLFLLDEGAKIGRLDKTGVTPFHVAAVMNHVKILQIFLDRGGDVNKVDGYGCTPLHFAAIGQDCLESVRLLLSAGADPKMRNKNGKTPMDLAVDGRRKEVVSLLKERGAKTE